MKHGSFQLLALTAGIVSSCLLSPAEAVNVEASHIHHGLVASRHHRKHAPQHIAAGTRPAEQPHLRHAIEQEGFLQRHLNFLGLHKPQEQRLRQPEDVERAGMILGVPKVVWVVLLDMLAMVCFISLIPLVMRLAK
eukprot:CAMPEP_0178424882 /NCGR_PEP_ID=MMETSP0689_2-20121128/28439_1 /TAXON_ID=160604 /ORGANISM="Amphidinium massartii, Strain CS-259" /LENGTH=135 /DNA_ID=CAMNT_0020046533 /DNA_START=45 /DNA_END=449 /DNA_ORIENTATION=+